jgi:hypothetical protein
MDPLKLVSVRLRTSTVEAIREAQKASHHRTIAAFVDALLREQLITRPVQPNVDRLQRAASSMK